MRRECPYPKPPRNDESRGRTVAHFTEVTRTNQPAKYMEELRCQLREAELAGELEE